MTNDHQRAVAQTCLRITSILAVRVTVTLIAAWLLIWGVFVLILRGIFDVPPTLLLWGLVGLPIAIAVGIASAIRSRPSEESVRALLDNHYQCGGLLMASEEAISQDWPVSLETGSLPRIQWKGTRSWSILLCSVAFIAAAFLVPARFIQELDSHRLQADDEVARLAEQMDVLKEEKILSPERAESLETSLEKLKQEAAGNDPAKTWEAMDHLEQSIDHASQQAAESLAQAARKFASAEELAAALNQARSSLSPEDLSTAMGMLAKDLQKSAEEEELMLSPELCQALKEQIEKGRIDPQQLEALAKSLGECKGSKLSKLQRLAKARMIDAEALKKCNGECKIDPEGLAKLLAECKDGKSLTACLVACQKPGRGGVSRGRGDAAMTWKDESSTDDMKFKEQILPPGAMASLKDSRLQGLSVGAPQVSEPAAVVAGGGLDLSTAGAGTARTQVILPEHKKVVQRYFSREPVVKPTTPAAP